MGECQSFERIEGKLQSIWRWVIEELDHLLWCSMCLRERDETKFPWEENEYYADSFRWKKFVEIPQSYVKVLCWAFFSAAVEPPTQSCRNFHCRDSFTVYLSCFWPGRLLLPPSLIHTKHLASYCLSRDRFSLCSLSEKGRRFDLWLSWYPSWSHLMRLHVWLHISLFKSHRLLVGVHNSVCKLTLTAARFL